MFKVLLVASVRHLSYFGTQFLAIMLLWPSHDCVNSITRNGRLYTLYVVITTLGGSVLGRFHLGKVAFGPEDWTWTNV